MNFRGTKFFFHSIPDERRDIGSAKASNFPDASRRGDVDLREVVSDHVDAYENEAAPLEFRTDGVADLALPRRELRRFRAPAYMHV